MRRLIAMSVLAMIACGDGSPAEPPPPGEGRVSMALARSLSSAVPNEADSAFVRVWHSAGTNAVRQVAIPAPGTETTVEISVPARTGYSVGVVAYRFNSALNVREALAGGRADDITVTADQASEVQLSVDPWSIALSAPDTLISGENTSITAAITGPVNDFFVSTFMYTSLTPWTEVSTLPASRAGTLQGNQLSFTFPVPTVTSDTTLYLQFDLRANSTEWQSTGFALIAFMPSTRLGAPLFVRRIKLAGGTIRVVF